MCLPFFRRLDECKPKYVLCRIFSCCMLFLIFSSAEKGFSDGKLLLCTVPTFSYINGLLTHPASPG